jgi:hypothetical protein
MHWLNLIPALVLSFFTMSITPRNDRRALWPTAIVFFAIGCYFTPTVRAYVSTAETLPSFRWAIELMLPGLVCAAIPLIFLLGLLSGRRKTQTGTTNG